MRIRISNFLIFFGKYSLFNFLLFPDSINQNRRQCIRRVIQVRVLSKVELNQKIFRDNDLLAFLLCNSEITQMSNTHFK